MTNEEARAKLEIIKSDFKSHYASRDTLDVLDIAIKALEQKETAGWISVSEQLPRENHAVLVYDPIYNNIYCAYLNGSLWTIYGTSNKIIHNVIAWMYLPEPPY